MRARAATLGGMSERFTIHEGDARDVLPTLPAGSFDAVITDPPYPEIDRPYGRMTEAAWHEMMRAVVAECRRLLTPTGSAVFVLQPNYERVGRMRPWVWDFLAEQARAWNVVQNVYWWNTNALPLAGVSRGLTRASLKYCAWLGPADCYRAQENVLRAPSAEFMAQPSHEERGRRVFVSGTTANQAAMQRSVRERGGSTPFNVIPIPQLSQNSSGALGHGAGTPLALCLWWARYIVPKGGRVLSPFCGLATEGIAALEHGGTFVGVEKMPEYVAKARARLAAVATPDAA